MHFKQLTFLLLLSLLFGCATSKNQIQEEPPGFMGRIMQNTTARYNGYYNANKIFQESLISSEDSYQENYTEELPVSVTDALATSGSLGGSMDEVLKKTTKVIDTKPYSKWIDDNYLLNGIAHYVQGEYEMAEEIFLYTTSEYKNGVEFDRVGARQKVKEVKLDKLKKEQAKERLKEIELEQKKKEQEIEDKIEEREEKAKKTKKAKKFLSRDEQFKAREKAKKEGRDLSTEEVLQEIREQQKILDAEGKKITEEDIEAIAEAPVLKNDNADVPGFLDHPLAAKDAMLWLAKTYITTDKFIAAQAVLTAINEDETFPNRLNLEYYLTYADMFVRLDNLYRAAEYINLAIESAKNKEKGRLYYVLGQVYTENGQEDLAKEAFATVKKYHPEYNMIYYAEMKNIRNAYKKGEFIDEEYVKELKRMSKDAKNLEFFSEVNYFLGNAYAAQGETENAIEAYEVALIEDPQAPFKHKDIHLTLADFYYKNNNYEAAFASYSAALEELTDDTLEKSEAELRASALEKIVTSYNEINLQDSLQQLALMPNEDLVKFLEKKAGDDIKDQVKRNLQKANENFGTGTSSVNASKEKKRNRNNNNSGENDSFYFYDIQQAANGFSSFKQEWGDRPNMDGWRRTAYVKRFSRAFQSKNKQATGGEEEDAITLSKDQLVAKYLSEVPLTESALQASKDLVNNSYIEIGTVFIKELGEFNKGEAILKELIEERRPEVAIQKEAQELLIVAYAMKGDETYKAQLSKSEAGKEALEQANKNLNKPDEALSEVEELYTQAFLTYQEGNYGKAVEFAEKSKSFDKNKYEDKFAFILATSKGYIGGQDEMNKQMKIFVVAHPKSPLKFKAEQLFKK